MPTGLSSLLIGAVLSSAVVSAVLTQGLVWFKEWRQRKGIARDTALSVAVELERYSRTCVHALMSLEYAIEEAVRRSSHDPVYNHPIPDFVSQVSVSSRELDMKFLVKLRELPDAIEAAKRQTSSNFEYDDPTEIAVRKVWDMARLARRAWVLAIEVRKHYDLDAPESHERNWNMHVEIQRVLSEEIRAEERNAESSRRMIEQLNAAARAQEPT